jgi:hypothetical protein
MNDFVGNWNEAVRTGRQLAEGDRKNKWDLADYALSLFPLVKGRPPLGKRTIREWIRECDLDLTVGGLKQYRETARAWPPSYRTKAAWSVHLELRSHPDRFSLVTDATSTTDTRKIMGAVRHSSGFAFYQTLTRIRTMGSYADSAARALPDSLSAAQRAELCEIWETAALRVGAAEIRLGVGDAEGPELRLVA